jgi:pyruvate ferredoxin oxidoreductase beta subunit
MTTSERTRFYQVGSWAAGNRLLDPADAAIQADQGRTNALTSGHRACQGCGEALAARWVLDTAMRVTAGNLVVVNATGCLEVFSTPYPESSWQVAWLHSLFGNAPAVAGGVAAALSAQGRADVRVIAQAGDGGTVDIGMGCLSGMFERGDDVLFVCYDNGGYMNTGVQRSAATPAYARTTTTPATGGVAGNPAAQGKDMARIAMAHRIPYVATATVADLRDLEAKVRKAMSLRGARYLHVLVPCPLGWATASGDTIHVARLATQSGLFPVFEAADGQVTAVTPIRQLADVRDYLRAQGRYRHLFLPEPRTDILDAIEATARRNILDFELLAGTALPEEARTP